MSHYLTSENAWYVCWELAKVLSLVVGIIGGALLYYATAFYLFGVFERFSNRVAFYHFQKSKTAIIPQKALVFDGWATHNKQGDDILSIILAYVQPLIVESKILNEHQLASLDEWHQNSPNSAQYQDFIQTHLVKASWDWKCKWNIVNLNVTRPFTAKDPTLTIYTFKNGDVFISFYSVGWSPDQIVLDREIMGNLPPYNFDQCRDVDSYILQFGDGEWRRVTEFYSHWAFRTNKTDYTFEVFKGKKRNEVSF